jgi:hypothetical protein
MVSDQDSVRLKEVIYVVCLAMLSLLTAFSSSFLCVYLKDVRLLKLWLSRLVEEALLLLSLTRRFFARTNALCPSRALEEKDAKTILVAELRAGVCFWMPTGAQILGECFTLFAERSTDDESWLQPVYAQALQSLLHLIKMT